MVEVERVIGFEELEAQVRQVPLLDTTQGHVHPYADARISLREFRYDEISPTTLYVLNGNRKIQAQLQERLQECGHHPLELNGALSLVAPDGAAFGLLPPIVEEAPEGMVLIDGIHRNYDPRLLGRTSFIGLCIEGVDEDYPVYAFPNHWDEIKEYDAVPSDPKLKKHYRVENPYGLYRDFSALKTGGPRTA